MRFLRKVGQRGVVTLPSEVRDAMGLHDGDIVEFEVLRIIKHRRDERTDATASDDRASPSHA